MITLEGALIMVHGYFHVVIISTPRSSHRRVSHLFLAHFPPSITHTDVHTLYSVPLMSVMELFFSPRLSPKKKKWINFSPRLRVFFTISRLLVSFDRKLGEPRAKTQCSPRWRLGRDGRDSMNSLMVGCIYRVIQQVFRILCWRVVDRDRSKVRKLFLKICNS